MKINMYTVREELFSLRPLKYFEMVTVTGIPGGRQCACTHYSAKHHKNITWTQDPNQVGLSRTCRVEVWHCNIPDCECPQYEEDNLEWLLIRKAMKRVYKTPGLAYNIT